MFSFVEMVNALTVAQAAVLTENHKWGLLAAGIGAGLAVIGGGAGIGKLAAAAMEGTARQPTAGNDIRTSMIISAALIEGATLFGVVVCLLLALPALR